MIFRKRIQNYTIESRLGGGRYGVCFLAHDRDGQKVVLKRFRKHEFRKNLSDNHHEAVVLSGLDHPAVPKLLGVINARQGYFFVLEYKKGLSLRQLLFSRHHIFSDDEIFRIGAQLADILVYIHSRSVIHGDLSISNIVYDGNRVSLLDFGLARYMNASDITPSLDHACFGNVLLYLLYSGYSGKKYGAWYEELDLDKDRAHFLKRLLQIEEGFADTEKMRDAFLRNF